MECENCGGSGSIDKYDEVYCIKCGGTGVAPKFNPKLKTFPS